MTKEKTQDRKQSRKKRGKQTQMTMLEKERNELDLDLAMISVLVAKMVKIIGILQKKKYEERARDKKGKEIPRDDVMLKLGL